MRMGQPSTPAQTNTSTRQTSDGKAIQTVIVNGLGSTVESAVKNAAENALIQVVGSFVSADKQIDRRSQIENGIRNETKNVSSTTREYSQGSIQGFEVLDSSQTGGITRVTARVDVRIDDFRAYMTKIVEGSTTVSKGLFASAASEDQQQTNATGLALDRVVKPLLANAGMTLTLAKPRKFAASPLSCRVRSSDPGPGYVCRDVFNYWYENHKANADLFYVFPVTATSDKVATRGIDEVAHTIANNECSKLDDARTQPNRSEQVGVSYKLRTEIPNLFAEKYGEHFIDRAVAQSKRFVAVVRRVGSSSFVEVCPLEINDAGAYDELVSHAKRSKLTLSLLDAEGELVQAYQFGPYASPSDGFSATMSSPDHIPPFIRTQTQYGGPVDIYPNGLTGTFAVVAGIPLDVLEKTDKATVQISQ